jgi:Protein kinase domain
MFVGKWKYCSPEHLGMLPVGERIDGRADLYSFGIVLYELLTGVPPFVADTPHAYLMKHASERPKSIRDTNPAAIAAPELEALIFRALEKDRNKRYASAREFAQAIERIAAGLPDTPGAPPPLPVEAEAPTEKTSVEQHAATVATRKPPVVPAVHRTLDRVASQEPTVERPRAETKRRLSWPLYAAAVVLAVLAAGGWMLVRQRPNPIEPAPQAPRSIEASTMTTVTPPALTATIPVAQGHLGINAYPWANVTSVRNLDNGQNVDIGPNVVTPTALDLAPGSYEVTLTNPESGATITRTVKLEPGADAPLWVNFADGTPAQTPDFGGSE